MNTSTTQKGTLPAREAKNNFGRMLDMAQRRPVTIQKKGRNVAVLMSYDEYERLDNLDDTYWGTRVVKAKREGVLSAKKSKEFLTKLAHAND